jgi:hypothetical protein
MIMEDLSNLLDHAGALTSGLSMSVGNTLSDSTALAMGAPGSPSVNPLPDRLDNMVPALPGQDDYAHTIGQAGGRERRPAQSVAHDVNDDGHTGSWQET